jgi:hypothetical protein
MFHTMYANRAAPLAGNVRLTSTLSRDNDRSYVDEPSINQFKIKLARRYRYKLNRIFGK